MWFPSRAKLLSSWLRRGWWLCTLPLAACTALVPEAPVPPAPPEAVSTSLSLVLKTIPVGITYAVWSGLGIVLITLAAWWLYGQTIDTAGLVGMGLILAGVVVLNVFSTSGDH